MTNRDKIIKKLETDGYSIGCYHNNINRLNYQNLKKILKKMCYGSTDVRVFLNRKPYVVEIFDIDGEYDFYMITKEEYITRYSDYQYNEIS